MTEWNYRSESGSGQPPYAGPETFLKAPMRSPHELEPTDIGVVGIPYDGTVTNHPGARFGPAGIRRGSAWWGYVVESATLTNMRTGDVADFAEVSVADSGDAPVYPTDRKRTTDSIIERVRTVTESTFPVILGGDHYCSYPSFEGVAAATSAETLGLVQLDAHMDIVGDHGTFGDEFHGSMARHIAESRFSNYEHISQVGLRGYERRDVFEFTEDVGLSTFPISEVYDRGIESVTAEAVESAAEGTDGVYVTFDIDIVDPSIAPGTGTPVPGGIDVRQALAAMEVLAASDDVVAIDLVEVSPPRDSGDVTTLLAAYLLVTFLERRFARPG